MGHAAPMASMASYEVLRRGPVSETKFGEAWHIAYNMSDDTAASWSDRLTRPPFVDSTNLYSAKIDRTETPHALRSTQPAPNTRPIASTQRGLAAISFRRKALFNELKWPEYPVPARKTHLLIIQDDRVSTASCTRSRPRRDTARRLRNCFLTRDSCLRSSLETIACRR